MRLAENCKKAKLNLSMSKSTSISIDCLCNGEDLDDSITRDDFEKMVQPLLIRLNALIKTITESVGTYGVLHSFELVGGNTRVPCVIKATEEGFGMTKSVTLNVEECFAEGAAVASAMESPM